MKKIFGFLALLILCSSAFAQEKNVSLDLRDAPIRTCLEMAFKQAEINNFVIDNNVDGFVTMTIKDQPFEIALKLIMRGATTPLTYIKENNVYIVKPRSIAPVPQTAGPDPIPENLTNNFSFERISLTFIDPVDLMSAFGDIILISQFKRYTGGMIGNNMGGFGNGANNNSFGGGGGFGGGMGLGLGGGGMGNAGGMMGGMGGMMGGMGMGGGMGGFGGGRNF